MNKNGVKGYHKSLGKLGVLWNIIILAILFLIAGELLVRATLTSPSRQLPDPELGYTNMPDVAIFQASEGFQTIQLNALGLNDVAIGAKSIGNKRLLFLGDSMLFAQQVARPQNFVSRIEENTGLDLVNGGRDALGPQQWPAMLQRLSSAVKPDILVVMLTRGDAYDLRGADVSFVEDNDRTRVKYSHASKDAIQEELAPVLRSSALATYLGRRAATMWGDLKSGTSWTSFALNGFRAPSNLAEAGNEFPAGRITRQMAELMEMVSSTQPTVFISIPSMVYKSKGKTELEPRSYVERRIFADAAKQSGSVYIDIGDEMADIYAKERKPFVGFANSQIGIGHLNSYGHAITGNVISQHLPQLIALAEQRYAEPQDGARSPSAQRDMPLANPARN